MQMILQNSYKYFFLFLLLSHSVAGQEASRAEMTDNSSSLKIDKIMQGEEFVGFLPEDISWSEDSRTVYFSWNPDGDTLRNTYKVEIGDDGTFNPAQQLSLAELKSFSSGGDYDKERNRKLFSKNGDLFLMDLSSNAILQITNTLERESGAGFSGNSEKVVFQKEGDLFSWDIASGTFEQLTDFRKGQKKKEKEKSDQEKWLEQDQLGLFEVLARNKEKQQTQKYRRQLLEPKRPKTYYYGDKRLSGIRYSPDLRFITFRLTTEAKTKTTDVPEFVTYSGEVENILARAKVGSPVDHTELGIYDRLNDTIFMVDHTGMEGIYDKPAYLREYQSDTATFDPKYNKPRAVVFHGPVFSDDGKGLVVVKSQDNKDRWLMLLEPETGELKLLDRQHDEAWIGGPGISNWNMAMGNVGWMPDNRRIWFQSEETGYSHLYTVNIETGNKKALTSGNFEILDAELSEDKQYFYVTANKETPFEHHFYRLPVNGGNLERITSLAGNHEVHMSPDEKWLAIRYSYSNKPWELYLMPNQAGAGMTALTKSTTEAFDSYAWRVPEIVRFAADDGTMVPARIYRPEAGLRNGAAVIFVHGAGYLQNVHNWWSSYYREYMFHNLLADNGFTVLDIDYRGSRGYGRDWRTAIYRHMGGKDLSDQVDGAEYLVEEHGIDPDRIGIYGGSYGGFITLMAMFNAAETFKSGAALRSVTDWAHYNHGYTSNILNTPATDSIAYRRSSPIYFAEGLEGHLLILHGMVDVNVQFQDVVRLAQRLVELGKDNWEFAVFPVEGHGFIESSSWANEYKRIYKLFRETLLE